MIRLVKAARLVERGLAPVLDVHVEVDHRRIRQRVSAGGPRIVTDPRPPLAELRGRAHLHLPAVADLPHPAERAVDRCLVGVRGPGIRRDRDGARLLDRRHVDPNVVEPVKPAVMGDRLASPEGAEDRHPLDHAADPLGDGYAHRGELGAPLRPARRRWSPARVRSAPDAGDQEGAAIAQEVEGGPLVSEHDRVAEDEARHARSPEGDAAGPPRDEREEDYGVEPRLGDQVVAGEDGVEQLRGVGGLAHRHQVLRVSRADDETPVRDAETDAHRHPRLWTRHLNRAGLMPNSSRNAWLKFDRSPNPVPSAISSTESSRVRSRRAASRNRARTTYRCGVTPVTSRNTRRKWNSLILAMDAS